MKLAAPAHTVEINRLWISFPARPMEAVLSWCDKLASTPAMGLTLDWHFVPGATVLAAIIPILDRNVKDEKADFSFSASDQFSGAVSGFDGFTYGFEPSKIYVSFQHRMKAKAISGGPPVMELLSQPMPYSGLLAEVSSKLIEMALLTPGNRTRNLTRVGIVTTTSVALDEIPPGIADLIAYFGKPWNRLDACNIQITATIGGNTKYSDRCSHAIVKPEKRDELLNITFDWQRTFSTGRAITKGTLEDIFGSAKVDALKYFEELAEGSRFDEDSRISTD